MTRSSISVLVGGRPCRLRNLEPSNFLATSRRCHLRIVSGLTMVAVSAISLPWAMAFSARMPRSLSVRRIRQSIWLRRTRLSSSRYSILRNRSSLTLPVMYASIRFQGIGVSSRGCYLRKFSVDELFDHTRQHGVNTALCADDVPHRLWKYRFLLQLGV